MKNLKNIGIIILAAGKGTRFQLNNQNKVVLPLNGKAMILHSVDLFKKVGLDPILVVVGHAKHSVINLLKDHVLYAEQEEQLGTAHAVFTALNKLPDGVENVVVVNGDDSAFYDEKLIDKLLETHFKTKAMVTFLTIEINNPKGLGRIIRNKKGDVIKIVEEKDATKKEKELKEINPGSYVFQVNFLREYIQKIEKSPVTGEFYLTRLIDLALKDKKKVGTQKAGFYPWRGVNTMSELEEANMLFIKKNT